MGVVLGGVVVVWWIEGVWLSLKSERVVVNVGGDAGDGVGLLAFGPRRGGLNGVNCL